MIVYIVIDTPRISCPWSVLEPDLNQTSDLSPDMNQYGPTINFLSISRSLLVRNHQAFCIYIVCFSEIKFNIYQDLTIYSKLLLSLLLNIKQKFTLSSFK